jgi:hypothetical protein
LVSKFPPHCGTGRTGLRLSAYPDGANINSGRPYRS